MPHGLALCPEERKTDGIVAELSVRENIALALQARMGLRRFLSRAEQAALASASSTRWASRPPAWTRRWACCPAATSRRP